MILTDFFKLLFDPNDFMMPGMIAGIFICFLAPLVGSIAVMRRLSLIADTLSHFSLAGVAIGVFLSKLIDPQFLKIDPIYTGMVFSIIGTFLIEKLRGFYKNYKELSMPIVMSFGIALSGFFIYITPGISSSMTTALLYGNILSTTWYDLKVILPVTIMITAFYIIFYKQIVVLCFDELYAKTSGINVRLFQLVLTLILSVVISLFIDLVGVLLISAILIVPVAASILLSHSFKGTLIHAIMISEFSLFIGTYISYELKFPFNSTLVLLNSLILFAIMGISRVRRHFRKEAPQKDKVQPRPFIQHLFIKTGVFLLNRCSFVVKKTHYDNAFNASRRKNQ
jgi:zinc transport system permease protein